MGRICISLLPFVAATAFCFSCGTKEDQPSKAGKVEASSEAELSEMRRALVLGSVADCELNSRWPCMCQNAWHCDDGSPCIGYDGKMMGNLGLCSSKTDSDHPTDCPRVGISGFGVRKVCRTRLKPGGCVCLLAGCDKESNPCPLGAVCVSPSCIASVPGCVEGRNEEKVCHPMIW